MLMLKAAALAVASFAGVQVMTAGVEGDANAPAAAGYASQIEAWRAARVERLQAPGGWTSLVGLHWLKEGTHSVGNGKDNDIVLAVGPKTLGKLTIKRGKVRIELDPASGATIDGKSARVAELQDDSKGKPTTVAFGTAIIYVIERDGEHALRVKDSEAATRKHFAGIDNFPIDPSWRVEAKWTPSKGARTLEIPNVLGTVEKMTVPGEATFTREGKSYTLLPVLETPDAKELWFIFADRTSGKQTYGAGRFLYADMPGKDGKVVIDFNKSYNPPCAFTSHATCPIAPPENRLDLAVAAGEKKYAGSGH
jgi:uncharacterized protein (DUF1684 family)